MLSRLTIGWLLAGWLVFGVVNCASGQVVLESALEEVVLHDEIDDRYGDYEPVSLTANDGPVLLSQIEEWVQPPGQTIPSSPARPEVRQPVPPPIAVPHALSMPPGPVLSGPVIFGPPYPQPRRPCPPWRPCGPEESFGGNWFVKQGFAGADFRGACDFHDRCLMSGCTDRKTCDKLFLAYLDNACHCSAFPVLCRIKAREFYLGVRLFGWIY